MSGHTFKVGDRVRADSWPSGCPMQVVLAEPDRRGQIIVRDAEGDYLWALPSELSPLPLFEPVERWAYLYDNGELGISMSEVPGVDNSNGCWVKVVISPAEDQS